MRFGSALVLVVSALALVPLACGGDDGSGSEPPANPRALLDRSFGSVRSARVSSAGQLELAGATPISGPVTFELEGPYVAGGGFPRFDWQGSAGVLGFDVDLEVVSLGDNLLVSVYGEGYEVGEPQFAALTERLSGLELAPGELVGAVRYEGRDDVDGTETYHLSAELDPSRATEGLGATRDALGISQVPAVSGRLDAWIGVEDELPRRLSVDASMRVAPEDRASLSGTRRADAQVDVALSEVNEPQDLPERPRGVYQPLSELFESLAGLSGLVG